MKADELRSNIQFKRHDVGPNRTTLIGTLEVHASIDYTAEFAKHPGALDEIKEQIRERIMRHLYDDQRAALDDALRDLLKAQGAMNYAAQSAACEKLMNAARCQKPVVGGRV
jgi:hypothetical protein